MKAFILDGMDKGRTIEFEEVEGLSDNIDIITKGKPKIKVNTNTFSKSSEIYLGDELTHRKYKKCFVSVNGEFGLYSETGECEKFIENYNQW